MVADRTKVMPMRELLQKNYGAKYITSLDLSSAFLQIPHEQFSRRWTAIQFESNVYQFTTVLNGFKNSLAAFIRAIGKVLGDCGLNNNLVMYVEDLFIRRLLQNICITLISFLTNLEVRVLQLTQQNANSVTRKLSFSATLFRMKE